MLPLYYNATIILTIIASFSIGKFLFKSENLSKILGSIATIFWIYWTLGGSEHFGHDKLWSQRLIIFQITESILTFVICFFLLSKFFEKEKRIEEKDKQIEENKNIINKLLEDRERIDNKDIIEYIEKNKKNNLNVEILAYQDEHLKIFRETFNKAKNTICILSGTATSSVIDNEFKNNIVNCLRRGVNIYIGFGDGKSYSTGQKSPQNIKAGENLKQLLNFSNKENTKGKIYLAEYKNHSKILTCDETYAVCGSFNWLSNARGMNVERSYVIHDKAIAKKESDAMIKYIQNNLLK